MGDTPDSSAETFGAEATGEALYELAVNTLRLLAADAVEQAKSGHPGMPMGMAEAAYLLWTEFLHLDPEDPDWHDRDRFGAPVGRSGVPDLVEDVPGHALDAWLDGGRALGQLDRVRRLIVSDQARCLQGRDVVVVQRHVDVEPFVQSFIDGIPVLPPGDLVGDLRQRDRIRGRVEVTERDAAVPVREEFVDPFGGESARLCRIPGGVVASHERPLATVT